MYGVRIVCTLYSLYVMALDVLSILCSVGLIKHLDEWIAEHHKLCSWSGCLMSAEDTYVARTSYQITVQYGESYAHLKRNQKKKIMKWWNSLCSVQFTIIQLALWRINFWNTNIETIRITHYWQWHRLIQMICSFRGLVWIQKRNLHFNFCYLIFKYVYILCDATLLSIVKSSPQPSFVFSTPLSLVCSHLSPLTHTKTQH